MDLGQVFLRSELVQTVGFHMLAFFINGVKPFINAVLLSNLPYLRKLLAKRVRVGKLLLVLVVEHRRRDQLACRRRGRHSLCCQFNRVLLMGTKGGRTCCG